MQSTVIWVPGAVGKGVNFDLPAWAPLLDLVSSAEITRVPSCVLDHPQADIVGALADHAAAAVVAAFADHTQAAIVAAVADHAAHGHDITTVGPAGGGGAVTDPLIPGPLESAGGGQVNVGAVDVLAAAQAHAAGAAAVAHVAGAALAHVAGAAAVAHAASNPVVAAVATKVDHDTITLDVALLLGDQLRLSYIEEGARIVP